MTIGVGTDIVSVERIARMIARRGDTFLQRWFTASEIAYCRSKAHPERHAAARFAAKEAVIKALRCPRDGPPLWRYAEVLRHADGSPSIRLSGPLVHQAESAGVAVIHLSLSQCAEYASATAVAERLAPTTP